MKKTRAYLITVCIIFCLASCNTSKSIKAPCTKTTLLFQDSGTNSWQENWMLDGQKSSVLNTDDGMELIAGTEHGNDAHHTVLWTKKSFKGNIAIEYDYTRTDTVTRCVNILYFNATGKGNDEFPTDISLWNHKRAVPAMSSYFNNMNTYHISYAAFAANEYSGDNDYIRLRRYNPNKVGLGGTNIEGDHFKTGLFKTGVTYHIQVLVNDTTIEMHIQNKNAAQEQLVCKWDISEYQFYESGRIGLRHMYTRSARYKNFKVWSLK